jgi:hypothetical protein
MRALSFPARDQPAVSRAGSAFREVARAFGPLPGLWVIRGSFPRNVAVKARRVRTFAPQPKEIAVKRFVLSPLFSYVLWGTILVLSLAVEHQADTQAVVDATPPATRHAPAA